MVNSDDFIKRLETILQYYNLSASAFADKIGIQRSSVSHLLSGRNNPSLDFVLKLLEVFPEIDLYWILNGKGSFPKEAKIETPVTEKKPLKPETTPDQTVSEEIETNEEEKFSPAYSSQTVEKIVIFYNDGTFKEYRPQ